MHRRRPLVAVLLALALAACSSTEPAAVREPAAPLLPTVTPEPPEVRSSPVAIQSPDPSGSDGPVGAVTAPAENDGPVTATMEALQIGGERYAAMGDPNAPLTIVEYSDFG